MAISQSNTAKNSLTIAGCQIAGKNASVLTVFEVPGLNSFSNNPMHSRAKQRARRREF
jgi:hypothetical protein